MIKMMNMINMIKVMNEDDNAESALLKMMNDI